MLVAPTQVQGLRAGGEIGLAYISPSAFPVSSSLASRLFIARPKGHREAMWPGLRQRKHLPLRRNCSRSLSISLCNGCRKFARVVVVPVSEAKLFNSTRIASRSIGSGVVVAGVAWVTGAIGIAVGAVGYRMLWVMVALLIASSRVEG